MESINEWLIPLRDGVQVSAAVHRPVEADASTRPKPAVVAFTPYGKNLFYGPRNTSYIHQFTQAGYSVVLVDMRGTGSSEGIKADAFEGTEQRDIYDCIEFIGAQRWCDGDVFSWGLSYGGITALKAAACGSSFVRAVAAIEGSTDPFDYEVARDGTIGLSMIIGEWSTMMLALNAVPASEGDALTLTEFKKRLKAMRPWHHAWLRHPVKSDEYWAGRSTVISHPTTPPILFITGWRGTQLEAAWSDFSSSRGQHRIICGPWAHGMPEESSQRPIDSVSETINWFNAHRSQPSERLRTNSRIQTYDLGKQEWSTWETFPPPTSQPVTLHLGKQDLLTTQPRWTFKTEVAFDPTRTVSSSPAMAAVPGEQSKEVVGSSMWTSAPVETTLELTGAPSMTLDVIAEGPSFDISVRLCEVHPDGSVWLISRSFKRYTGKTPHQPLQIDLALDPIHYSVSAGNRLALFLAASNFPEHWPNEHAAGYSVLTGPDHNSSLSLTSTPRHADRGEWHPPEVHEPSTFIASEVPGVLDADVTNKVDVHDDSISITATSSYVLGTHTGEVVKVNHEYTIYTHRNQPEQTVVNSNTRIVAGLESKNERTVTARCSVSPRESFAEVSVRSESLIDDYEYSQDLTSQ